MQLSNYEHIFAREDFSFICKQQRQDAISDILLNKLPLKDGNEIAYRLTLENYLNSLNSFLKWINDADLEQASSFISRPIIQTITLFQNENRDKVSKGYCQKNKAAFTYGLSKLLRRISEIFLPQNVVKTSIDVKKLALYILDKKIGLGRFYKFNTSGKYAAASKISTLSKDELICAMGLILNPTRKRNIRGWIDLGAGQALVRVLAIDNCSKIFYIFRRSEHKDYDYTINYPPPIGEFKAA